MMTECLLCVDAQFLGFKDLEINKRPGSNKDPGSNKRWGFVPFQNVQV